MSESKHTKTPWIRDGLSIYALDELPGVYIKGKPVQANRMYIRIEDHPNGLASKEETEANAALVFAAPDLLAALKGAREELRLIRMKDCDRVYDPTLRLKMDIAIHKAEGGNE